MRKADTCAAALLEARRLGGAAMFDSLYGQLSGRVRDLLDELDELLLYLDHRSDRAVFERMAALHSGYEELEYRRGQIGA